MSRTVPQQIDIGNASSIYMSNKLSGGKIHGGLLDEKNPMLIYLVRQALEWLYELDPTHEDLDTEGNYLIAICPDAPRAEASIIGGGSTPTVTNVATPAPLDFIVSGASFIVAGATTKNIPQFMGYNIEFTRGNLLQYTTAPPDGFSTYYSWNRTTGLLTLLSDIDPFGAATTGEQFRISPTI